MSGGFAVGSALRVDAGVCYIPSFHARDSTPDGAVRKPADKGCLLSASLSTPVRIEAEISQPELQGLLRRHTTRGGGT